MDVVELLSYKPPKEPKRENLDDEEEVEVRPRGKRLASVPESHYYERRPPKASKIVDENKENLQAEVPEIMDTSNEFGVLDETNLKKLLLSFEKKVLKNEELRIKFPDQPERFMDSEIELNDVIQEMHVIATQPDLYHILVELNSVSSILLLLTHDNTDIAIAVVDLLQEMADIDTLNESEGAEVLIDAMLTAQVVALLVQDLERLDETVKEETEGVHNTLGCERKVEKILLSSDSENQHPLKDVYLKKAFDKCRVQTENLDACKTKFLKTFFKFLPKSLVESEWPKEFYASWTTFCADLKDIWKTLLQKKRKQEIERSINLINEMRAEKRANIIKVKATSSGFKAKLSKRKFQANIRSYLRTSRRISNALYKHEI